jgi:hypothetical protein
MSRLIMDMKAWFNGGDGVKAAAAVVARQAKMSLKELVEGGKLLQLATAMALNSGFAAEMVHIRYLYFGCRDSDESCDDEFDIRIKQQLAEEEEAAEEAERKAAKKKRARSTAGISPSVAAAAAAAVNNHPQQQQQSRKPPAVKGRGAAAAAAAAASPAAAAASGGGRRPMRLIQE